MALDSTLTLVKGKWNQHDIEKGYKRHLGFFKKKVTVIEKESLFRWRNDWGIHGEFFNLYHQSTSKEADPYEFNTTKVVVPKERLCQMLTNFKDELGRLSKLDGNFGWRIRELEEQISAFAKILNETDFAKETVIYNSSW